MFGTLQEILQNYPFLMSQNFETHGYEWYRVKRIKSILGYKGNSSTRFGEPLY